MEDRYVQQFKTPRGKEVLQELIGFWASYADCVNAFLAAYQQTEEAK